MAPIVTSFIQNLNQAKSISRILAILSEHPKLIQSLAQWNAIYIVNNKPVNKINGLQSPCNKEELVSNIIGNVQSLVNSYPYGDVNDPMSPAFHKPIKIEATAYAKQACQSLKTNLAPKFYHGLNYTPPAHKTTPKKITSSVTTSVSSSASLDVKTIFGSSSAPTIISNKAQYQLKSKSPLLANMLNHYNPNQQTSTAQQTDHLIAHALQQSSSAVLSKKAKKRHVKSQKSDSEIDVGFKQMLGDNTTKSSATNSSKSSIHAKAPQSSQSIQHNNAVNGKNPF